MPPVLFLSLSLTCSCNTLYSLLLHVSNNYCVTHAQQIELINRKWTTSWQNLLLTYANNKVADQPAHPRSLISDFVIRCLHSIIPQVISEISSLYLASLAVQAGLCLTCSQTPKTGFLVTRLKCIRYCLTIHSRSSVLSERLFIKTFPDISF